MLHMCCECLYVYESVRNCECVCANVNSDMSVDINVNKILCICAYISECELLYRIFVSLNKRKIYKRKYIYDECACVNETLCMNERQIKLTCESTSE